MTPHAYLIDARYVIVHHLRPLRRWRAMPWWKRGWLRILRKGPEMFEVKR